MIRLAFLAILSLELALVYLATREPRDGGRARWARLGVFIVPLAIALGCRAYVAIATPDILEWDETYYLSQAVTAADGRGLYPYVFGYAPMTILGGQGYAAYLQALAVLVGGPSILPLRIVSLLGSAVALLAFWLLVRRLYGSGAAWAGTVVLATLRLFILSNTVRMDVFTVAWVSFALLMLARAFADSSRRSHFLAGLTFGAGLQFHLDSVVTFGAGGLLYLVKWITELRTTRRFVWPTAGALYVGGWLVGFGLFVLFNILPDPEAFYRTTVRIRVDATSWYSTGTSSVAGSFFDPAVIFAKEVARYRILTGVLHPLELLLFGASLLLLLVRRSATDLAVLLVVGGVFVLSAIVLNNESPLYFIHVIPALVVPVAALFPADARGMARPRLGDLSAWHLVAFAVIASALTAVNSVKVTEGARMAREDAQHAALASVARERIDRTCRIAGDGDLYVRYFADYPYFISLRPTEVSYAMLFHGAGSEEAYWDLARPGAVVATKPLSSALERYLARNGFVMTAPGVWVDPDGCSPGP